MLLELSRAILGETLQKRVIAIVNLSLECAGLMRGKMPKEFEADIASCNNLSELQNLLTKKKKKKT